jgi:hypothetical protein
MSGYELDAQRLGHGLNGRDKRGVVGAREQQADDEIPPVQQAGYQLGRRKHRRRQAARHRDNHRQLVGGAAVGDLESHSARDHVGYLKNGVHVALLGGQRGLQQFQCNSCYADPSFFRIGASP